MQIIYKDIAYAFHSLYQNFEGLDKKSLNLG